MTEEQAKQLMAAGKISSYAIVDGRVEIKAPMDGTIESTWPDEDKRSR